MKFTDKKTYLVVRAILREKKFKQYQISKEEKVAFSQVNMIVNWMVSLGYVGKRKGELAKAGKVGKRKGYYELISPGALFGLFHIYRQLKPYKTFDVDLSNPKAIEILKGRAALCLTSALSFYDNYYRDSAIYAYVLDEKLLDDLKELPEGLTRIEIYKEDLNRDDFVRKKSILMTNKTRTIIDLYCANRAYAAERLIKREFL